MSPVAAVCPVHGPFASRAFDFGGVSSGVTFRNSAETCPQCGRPSRIMEGTYDIDSRGFATARSAPRWARAALDHVHRSMREIEWTPELVAVTAAAATTARSQLNSGDTESAMRTLEQANPDLARAITRSASLGAAPGEKWSSPSVIIGIVGLILVVLQIVLDQMNPAASVEEIRQVVEQALQTAATPGPETAVDLSPASGVAPAPDAPTP